MCAALAPLRRVIIYIYSYIRLCTPLGVQTAKRRSTPYFTAYHMLIKYAPHAVNLIGPPGYPKTAPNGAPGGSRHKRSAGLSNLLKSRPRRPHFSNFGPPAKRGLFCKKVFGHGEKAWFSGFGRPRGAVGHLSRFGAHLPLGHFSRFDPKVPHFSRKFPPVEW